MSQSAIRERRSHTGASWEKARVSSNITAAKSGPARAGRTGRDRDVPLTGRGGIKAKGNENENQSERENRDRGERTPAVSRRANAPVGFGT